MRISGYDLSEWLLVTVCSILVINAIVRTRRRTRLEAQAVALGLDLTQVVSYEIYECAKWILMGLTYAFEKYGVAQLYREQVFDAHRPGFQRRTMKAAIDLLAREQYVLLDDRGREPSIELTTLGVRDGRVIVDAYRTAVIIGERAGFGGSKEAFDAWFWEKAGNAEPG